MELAKLFHRSAIFSMHLKSLGAYMPQHCTTYLSTVNIWSSLTRTHDTDLLIICFTYRNNNSKSIN